MYKVVWLCRFAPGKDAGACRHHWSTVHGPLGAQVAGIQRYVQNHAQDSLGLVGIAERPRAFDGYSCCWYDDEEAFTASLRTPEWAKMGEDSPNLFDHEWFWGWSAELEEYTVIEGDRSPFKVAWVVRFKDDIRGDEGRRDEAHEYWKHTHGAFALDVPGIDRYVQNHAVDPIGEWGVDETLDLNFDGFSECWFADRNAFDAAMASPAWDAMNRDAENLFDLDFSLGGMSVLVEEHVVKDAWNAVPA